MDADEFHNLAISAGVEPIAVFSTVRRQPDPKYLIGKGKALEIAASVSELQADMVLIDYPLSPSQERNLERLLDCRVSDRRTLILSIFVQRARTHEAKLQVELAQLEYLSTRLVRGWIHLERQVGGIGVRGGPGETQLELDRRLIGDRIKRIRQRLEQVRKRRRLRRRARIRAGTPVASLVGYTNAGKSTLFNALTGADVPVADRLFQTLTTTVRRLECQGRTWMIADTVGFIDSLPHELVAAFRATLEEVLEATVLLHVIDASTSGVDQRIEQVNTVLETIGAAKVPQILIYNKCDRISDRNPDSATESGINISQWPSAKRDQNGNISPIWISARDQSGIGWVRQAIAEQCRPLTPTRRFRLPASAGRLRARLYSQAVVINDVGLADGGWDLTAELPQPVYEWLQVQENLGAYRYEGTAKKTNRSEEEIKPPKIY